MGRQEALSGPKVSAKDKYTASSVLAGAPTEFDKRQEQLKKNEEAKRTQQRETQRRTQHRESARRDQGARDQERMNQQREQQREAEEARRESVERQKLEKPGGWRNVVDVMKIALNPFSKERIKANIGEGAAATVLEAVANNPYTAAGLVTGVGALVRGATAGIAAVTSRTAVSKAATVGTFVITSPSAGVAGTMATNTATTKATASLLTKIVGVAAVSTAVVGTLMGVIGTYPFAGFIKEEALQTLGFGVATALGNDDIAGAEAALELQDEVLNPGVWDEIKAKIPFVNVLAQLDDFYSAAVIKQDIDKKVVSDLKFKIEHGETDSQMYARIADERTTLKEQERVSDAEYYEGIAARQAEAKAASRAADAAYYKGLSAAATKAAKKKRADDAAYWAKIAADKDAEAARKRVMDEEYWNEYYKSLAKFKANSAPSNLKFGLL